LFVSALVRTQNPKTQNSLRCSLIHSCSQSRSFAIRTSSLALPLHSVAGNSSSYPFFPLTWFLVPLDRSNLPWFFFVAYKMFDEMPPSTHWFILLLISSSCFIICYISSNFIINSLALDCLVSHGCFDLQKNTTFLCIIAFTRKTLLWFT
jgi:hypothetical protein